MRLQSSQPVRANLEDSELLHEIFERAALAFAGQCAIELPPRQGRPERIQVTYAELRSRSATLAGHLSESISGVEPIVAILMPRDRVDLYAAQLGVMMAGGAFTCPDSSAPAEQVGAILRDADAAAVVSDAAGLVRVREAGAIITAVRDVGDGIVIATLARAGSAASSPRPPESPLAYVIYTSGTTGQPKGVLIEHRGVVNLALSDLERYGLGPGDRVTQVSSPAYDSSIEETWLAFAAGATLIPLDEATVRLGPDLVPFLRRERITVFCPPPTLLRAMVCADPATDLPDLKLLYVGGEVLPQDLSDRWSASCWLENGYGPTECTVTVTRTRMAPGRPVTIGRPLRGHAAWILDERLQPVMPGESGEMCISGPGVARGYHQRPELTREKFPTVDGLGRVYRTGDMARMRSDGELEFLGRIDGQVKLRGYRVELGAIEAGLVQIPGVLHAACAVQKEGGVDILTAHIVAEDPTRPPSVDEMKSRLRRRLPEYMVPARFGFLTLLPTTIGGKTDRARLPRLDAPASAVVEEVAAPRNETERMVRNAFAAALVGSGSAGPRGAGAGPAAGAGISIHRDFFLDLGGDSLTAVGVICSLRAAGFAHVTVRDLYERRTIASLSERLGAATPGSPHAATAPTRDRAVRSAPAGAIHLPHPAVTILQGLWIAAGLAIAAIAGYLVAFRIVPVVVEHVGFLWTLLLAPVAGFIALVASVPASVLFTMLLKRLLIGRYRAERIRVGSPRYLRHWIVEHSARLIPWGVVEGTVFLPLILRALGARVGRQVHVHRGVDFRHGGWDLLSIGDNVTLSQECSLRLTDLEDGHLVIGAIEVGADATVETRGGLSPGSSMGPGSVLAALSWLPCGRSIPAGERWDGIPARPAGRAAAAPELHGSRVISPAAHGALIILSWFGRHLMAAMTTLVFGVAAMIVASDRGLTSLEWLYGGDLSWLLVAAMTAISVICIPISLVGQALLLRLLGPTRSGVISPWSLEYLAAWIKSGAVDSAGAWLSGTLFWPAWLRLAGMRIGRDCEISTLIDVIPDTVEMGDESFLADGIYFCSPVIHRGTVTISHTRLGSRTFIGNHAVIPSNHDWPSDLFVGVCTVADPARSRPQSDWFGHPPMELPRREVLDQDRRLTHDPPLIRRISRLFWESLRFTIPVYPLLILLLWLRVVSAVDASGAGVAMRLLLVFAATAAALAAFGAAIIVLKWLLLGRVRPGRHPLWSCWCSRWDFLFVAWNFYARGLLGQLEGTPFLIWFLRAIGVRIGRGVVLGRGFEQVVDPDMLTFEDGATVACQFQAHSFEDRILKIDRLTIRRGASAGSEAVVFYGADIGEGAHVAPHSVVMKQERLDARGRYQGCPTQPA